jgi:hypothetical protein
MASQPRIKNGIVNGMLETPNSLGMGEHDPTPRNATSTAWSTFELPELTEIVGDDTRPDASTLKRVTTVALLPLAEIPLIARLMQACILPA